MSDLIEKLIQKLSEVEAARGPAKHILNDRLADLGQVAWDHWEEIVEALETVREIERLNRVDETMEEVDADIRAAFRTEKIHSLQSQIATLTAERDEARKDKLYLGLELDRVKAELADLARRSIAARQEVVGLLKWLKDKSESGLSITYLLQSNNPESVKKASRILQIIEGEGE